MKRSGFSMIELVFVIVILGVLAAVAIPRFVATRTDAQIATARSDLSTIQKQVVAKVFADNIDSTANNAPDPNKKVADQQGGFTMAWSEWMLLISGVSRDKFRPGGEAWNGNNDNSSFTGTGGGTNGARHIDVLGNISGTTASGKGTCGGILGISKSGFMIFDPTRLNGKLLSGIQSSEKDGSFCKGLSASFRSSGDWGNRSTPLSTSGTIEW